MWDFNRHPLNHYEMAMKIYEITGTRVLLVTQSNQPGVAASAYENVAPRGSVSVRLDSKRARTLYLFDMEGYTPPAG